MLFRKKKKFMAMSEPGCRQMAGKLFLLNAKGYSASIQVL